jgi:hypothetical protein
VIDGGKQIGLLAAAGEEPVIIGDTGAGIEVSDGAVLYARGVQSRQNGSDEGLTVGGAGSAAWLDACEVVDNNGGGISVSSGGYLWLRNSIVGGNGSGAGPSRGLTVAASTADILYSTLARNDADTEDDSLLCTGAADVTVRNAILVGRDPSSIECAGLSMTYSAADEAVTGTGNEDVGEINSMWFVSVVAANFRLSATGGPIFEDIAEWQTGDPATDIEGAARPNTDGTPDYAGADLP